MNRTIKGIGVSPGISIGRAHIIQKNEAVVSGELVQNEEAILHEIAKYDQAVSDSLQEIEAIKTEMTLSLQEEDLDILETQIELLNDPQLKSDVVHKITSEQKNANDALIEVTRDIVQVFKNMDDEYMSARSVDVEDISNRILRQLNHSSQTDSPKFEKNTILIAEDIAPSDTITMDISLIAGFATRSGGKTSHTAILAKSKGIPAVVGCGEGLEGIKNNDLIITDGSDGLVIINPDEACLSEYQLKRDACATTLALLKSSKDTPAITKDGKRIKMLANISGAVDMEDVTANGGEGVGLLRTEMLFMGRTSLPNEEEQFQFYKEVALKSAHQSVTIRTLDVGGDKELPYLNLPAEQNPFLGYRAIRICLDRKDLFLAQLKAILRASVYGDLKIMFPMISSLQELRAAKAMVGDAKNELVSENIPFNGKIEIGMMIEIPSAAIMADLFAKEVDFFSIGTNDLCQYTLAADRMNPQVEKLYDPFNPAVLRLISYVIEQANLHHIHVAMCGEMASDPLATQLLLGMGLDEFSMSPSAIPFIKREIINNSMIKARELKEKVMKMDNSASIIQYLQEISQ